MARATRTVEYAGATPQCLDLAFELAIEEWKLGFTPHLGAKPRLRVMPARDLGRLAREIAEAKKWHGGDLPQGHARFAAGRTEDEVLGPGWPARIATCASPITQRIIR